MPCYVFPCISFVICICISRFSPLSLSISLLLSMYFVLSISLFLYISFVESLSVRLCMSFLVFLSFFVSVSLVSHLYLSLSLSFFLHLSVTLCNSLSLSVLSLSVLSVFSLITHVSLVYLFLSRTLSLSLSLCVCVCVCVCMCVCVCVCVFARSGLRCYFPCAEFERSLSYPAMKERTSPAGSVCCDRALIVYMPHFAFVGTVADEMTKRNARSLIQSSPLPLSVRDPRPSRTRTRKQQFDPSVEAEKPQTQKRVCMGNNLGVSQWDGADDSSGSSWSGTEAN